MFKILYGNKDPFENISPTPLIERSISSVFYAKKHGSIENFILKGTITGSHCENGNEFSGFFNSAEKLLNNFSKPFQSFKIYEEVDGAENDHLFSCGNAIIRSIDFEESAYAGILPYSISLDVFDKNSFVNYGIMEPNQTVSFEEKDNGDVLIKKTSSANGFNTDSPAIENAVNFVKTITGISNIVSPLFISSSGLNSAILISFEEKLDRLSANYEITEGWIFNNKNNYLPNSILETSVSLDSDENGFRVSVDGKIKGGINSTISGLRSDFKQIDIYGLADTIYSKYSNGDLFIKPISKKIDENNFEKTVSFSYLYSDKISEDPYLIDVLSVNFDEEKNKICIQSKVEIRSTDNCPSSRWTKVKNFSNNFSLLNWTKNKLQSLGYSLTLPNKVTTESKTYDEKNGSISLSLSVCEKKIIIPNGFDDFEYNVSISPAIPTFVPFQGIDSEGDFTVQKLGGLRRQMVTIQGNGIISNCASFSSAKTSLLNHINNIKSNYLHGTDIFLSQHSIQRGYGELRNKISFSFSWNEKESQVIPNNKLNSTI